MADIENRQYKTSDGFYIREKSTVIGTSKLSGKTRYSFCPTCYRNIGEDKSALSPLTIFNCRIEQQRDDGKFYRSFEEKYFCERCHKTWGRIELEDQYIEKPEKAVKDAT